MEFLAILQKKTKIAMTYVPILWEILQIQPRLVANSQPHAIEQA